MPGNAVAKLTPSGLFENSQSIAYALRAPLSCDQSAAVAAMTCQALEPDFVRYHSLSILVAMPLPDSMGAVDQLKRTITKAGLTPQRDGRLRLKVPTRKKSWSILKSSISKNFLNFF
jgi:hypothetical protein